MSQEFDAVEKAHVRKDQEGIVRALVYEVPIVSGAATAQQAAQEYLAHHAELLGMKQAEMTNLALSRDAEPVDEGTEYRLHSEKHQFDTTTVTYDQTYLGLPVWDAGVSVHMKSGPYRIVSVESLRHPNLKVKPPSKAAV